MLIGFFLDVFRTGEILTLTSSHIRFLGALVVAQLSFKASKTPQPFGIAEFVHITDPWANKMHRL